jgi:hypothetical protein
MAKSALKHVPTFEESTARRMSTDQGVITGAIKAVQDFEEGNTASVDEFRKAVKEKRKKTEARPRVALINAHKKQRA